MEPTELQNAFDLPRYYIVGDRPVQLLPNENGGMLVQKFDWETGFFVEGNDFLGRVMFGKDEVERVTVDEFILHTETIRRQRFKGNNPVFVLYDLISTIEKTAEAENRILTADEKNLITITQKKTFSLFEQVSTLNEDYFSRW